MTAGLEVRSAIVLKWLKKKALVLYVHMVREKKPPEFIARGWAIGMFIGCSVPFGFQLVVSVPLSFLLKGSRIGATLGTFITNPFTIFIIYPIQCCVADRLFFGGNLSYDRLAGMEWTFESVKALGTEAFWAFLIGGLLFALVMTPLTYFMVLRLVRRYRERTARSRKRV